MRLREFLELQAKNNRQLNEWSTGRRWVDDNGKIHDYGLDTDKIVRITKAKFKSMDKDDVLYDFYSNSPEIFQDYKLTNGIYDFPTGFQPNPTKLNFEFGYLLRAKFSNEVNLFDVIKEDDLREVAEKREKAGWFALETFELLEGAVFNYGQAHPDTLLVLWDDSDNFFGACYYEGPDEHATGIKYSKYCFEHATEALNTFALESLKNYSPNSGDPIHDLYESLKLSIKDNGLKDSFSRRSIVKETNDYEAQFD